MKKNVNKLNEKDESQVAGGYAIWNKDGAFRDTSQREFWKYDYRYDRYCDFCNKKMEGKGAINVKGGRHACVDCYKKLSEINKNVSEIDFTNDQFA